MQRTFLQVWCPGLRIAAGFADHEVDSGFALMRAPE